MKEAIVLDHFRDTRQGERDYFVSIAPDYADSSDFIRGVLSSPDYVRTYMPRPSLEKLIGAYTRARYFALYAGEEKSDLDKLVKDVILPASGVIQPIEPVSGSFVKGDVDICTKAEVYYSRMPRQIKLGIGMQGKISVYHDAAGKPIALRKKRAASSALALEPISADGLLVPVGTIMRTSRAMDAVKTGSIERGTCVYSTYKVDGPIEVCPARLSPWAYEGELDRALFAVDTANESYMPLRGRAIEGRTIDDFRSAAHRVMKLCGVN